MMAPSTDKPERGSKIKTTWSKAKATLGLHSKNRQASSSGDAPSGDNQPSQNTKSKALLNNNPPTVESASRSIFELWEEAYDQLIIEDGHLINRFEAILSESLTGALGLAQSSSTVAFSGLGRIQKHQHLKILLDKKIQEVENGTWKLSFRSHELRVKDLLGPVVSTIEWAKDYIGTAMEASPYASMAWTGVCLLLPVEDSFYNIRYLFSPIYTNCSSSF